MAKKKATKTATKKSTGFSVSKILDAIKTENSERYEDRIKERVTVMVNSLAKREAETEHYRTRTERMLKGLEAAGSNVGKLERWFAKGF